MRATRKCAAKRETCSACREMGKTLGKFLPKVKKPERPGLALVEWHV